ncbi:MAG TPA: hypothetical protein VIP70_10950 [Nitrososphaeraceae archaeon]
MNHSLGIFILVAKITGSVNLRPSLLPFSKAFAGSKFVTASSS